MSSVGMQTPPVYTPPGGWGQFDTAPSIGGSSGGFNPMSLFSGIAGGPWGLGLGLLSSIFGMTQQNSTASALSNLLNQSMGNETKLLNQSEQQIGALDQNASQYTSVLPGLSANMNAENAGAGAMAPGAALEYMMNAMNPSALQATTGVNQLSPTQALLQYSSQPGQTAVGKMTPELLQQLLHGQTNKVYSQEAKHGLSPQYQANAQNQLQQNFQQSMANINANATPGQNLGAAQQAAQNNLLTQSSNLGGQLALESQQMKNTGAQGLQSEYGQAQQLGQVSDAQRMQMLQEAMNAALGYNQTELGNQSSAAGFGQNVLQNLTNFSGQGMQAQEYGLGTLASLFSGLTSQTSGLAGAAMGANSSAQSSNPFSGLLSLFGGV